MLATCCHHRTSGRSRSRSKVPGEFRSRNKAAGRHRRCRVGAGAGGACEVKSKKTIPTPRYEPAQRPSHRGPGGRRRPRAQDGRGPHGGVNAEDIKKIEWKDVRTVAEDGQASARPQNLRSVKVTGLPANTLHHQGQANGTRGRPASPRSSRSHPPSLRVTKHRLRGGRIIIMRYTPSFFGLRDWHRVFNGDFGSNSVAHFRLGARRRE